MEASTRNRSSQGTTVVGHFQRSLSPSGRFFPSSITTSSSSTPIIHRPTSPTRVTLGRSVSPSPSVRFSASRRHPLAAAHHHHHHQQRPSPRSLNLGTKKTCMCSPTTHPGSFRCSLHKGSMSPGYSTHQTSSYRPSQHHLNTRRSAMTNSLVRIGTVEGDLLRRALSALIRPSSHSLRRRADFRPQKSRLSAMSKAEGL